jgi:hypothetical protein
MQRLEVSCAVRPIYGSLGAKGLSGIHNSLDYYAVPIAHTDLQTWKGAA